MIEQLKALESLVAQSAKQAEASKNKYIEACRKKGISEEEIARRVKKIEDMSKEYGDKAADQIMRKVCEGNESIHKRR